MIKIIDAHFTDTKERVCGVRLVNQIARFTRKVFKFVGRQQASASYVVVIITANLILVQHALK